MVGGPIDLCVIKVEILIIVERRPLRQNHLPLLRKQIRLIEIQKILLRLHLIRHVPHPLIHLIHLILRPSLHKIIEHNWVLLRHHLLLILG